MLFNTLYQRCITHEKLWIFSQNCQQEKKFKQYFILNLIYQNILAIHGKNV